MRRLLFLLALIVDFGALIRPASAQDHTVQRALEALTPEARARVVSEDPLLRFRTQAVPGGRVDLDAGVLRAAYRIPRPAPQTDDPEDAARAYLRDEAPRFGWNNPDDDLTLLSLTPGRYSSHLTFQQTFHGLPVYNRLVKVSLDAEGHPTMVLSGFAPHLRRATSFQAHPSLTATEAEARARDLVGRGASHSGRASLLVYPSREPRLVWRVLVWPEGSPGEWEVLVEAHSGAVLQVYDQSTHAQGQDTASRGAGAPARQNEAPPGRSSVRSGGSSVAVSAPGVMPVASVDGTGLVFDPDPLTTAGVEYGAPYVDADDADVQVLNDERLEVPLREISLGSDGLYRLEGPFVVIDGSSHLGGTASTPPAEVAPEGFRYGRSDDFFEAVMAYYHVDQSQRYVQRLDVGRAIQAGPIHVNPHGFGINDDSRYYPGLNGIAFGDGGIDDAEDADVIWHEYGHALLQGSAPGLLNNDEGRALHEGWSDYWAASYSRGLIDAGKVPLRDWRKVFTWDGNEFWNGRMLDSQGHYPEDTRCDDGPCGNAIYTDGLVWATTLMDIYGDLMDLYGDTGKTVTDRLNLASHGYLAPPVTFADAAEALIQADLDLYGGSHLAVLIDRLAARGYVDASSYGPLVAHDPVTHVEDAGGTVTILAEVRPVSAPVVDVLAYYSVNGESFEVLDLASQGDNRYSGALTLPAGTTEVTYYLEATDEAGLQTLLPEGAPENTFTVSVDPDGTATAVEASETGIPTAYQVLPNYPNPFNPRTTIRFGLPNADHVSITVYNTLGQQVATVIDRAFPPGWHTVQWDAVDVSSGVYVYRIEAGPYRATKTMVVVQ